MKLFKWLFIPTLFVLPITSCSLSISSIQLDEIGNNIDIHTDVINDFLKNPVDENLGAKGDKELSHPKPVHLSWTTTTTRNVKFTVSVSEHSDMHDAFAVSTTNNYCDFYNCKVNTKYYWQVKTGSVSSNIGTFKTANQKVRMLKVDGVTNCRDLGGYTTSDNKTIKQGLIYRTGRYNKSNQETIEKEITSEGEYVLTKQLGLKTEMDLRVHSDNEAGGLSDKSVVSGVNYKPMVMEWKNKHNLLLDNKTMVTKIYNEVLSDPNSYPLSFHCNIGTDRTGCIAYSLLALCGVEKNDLIADYLLSNYGVIGGGGRRFNDMKDTYPADLDNGEGTTLKQKTEYVLKNTYGVTQNAIDSIRNILVE